MVPGNIDFGEGIPNYMSPEYVVATRDILAHITFDTLLDDTTATELARQEVWPMMRHWDDGAVEYLREKYAIMAGFVSLAADLDNHLVLELV